MAERTAPAETPSVERPPERVDDTDTRIMRLQWDPEGWPGVNLVDAWLDIGSEIYDFYAERLRADVKAQHLFLHCRSPAEAQRIQMEFMQKAINDYRDEAGKLIEMGARAGNQGG